MCSGNADVAAIPGGSCDGPCYPGWPFFTPDGRGVIFSLISEPDFAVAFPGRDMPSKSELWYADVGAGTLMRMANANKEAALIIERGKREIDDAKDAALRELAQVATDQALALAGKLLQQKLQPADHARLIEESLAKFPKTKANLN